MSRLKNLIIAIIIIISSMGMFKTLLAQDYLRLPGQNQITVIDSDQIIHAHVLVGKSHSKIQNYLFYYWFKSAGIFTTEGGFDGQLLDGDYKKYYLNHNLARNGQFYHGLKNGTWKDWNSNGSILSITQYKNGKKDGKYSLADTLGNIIETGNYKNDLLHGKQISISPSGKIHTHVFRAGIMLADKTPGLVDRAFNRTKKFIKHITGRLELLY